ncbi:MAG: septum formation protein Maf [Chloroflexi bacterium]|nr:septum formation protein Maf [Chloroflexota bacterium]
MASEPILLASSSARRRELFSWIIDNFTVFSADIDESPLPHEAPIAYCKRMAREKAIASLNQPGQAGAVLLAADTTVILNDTILGKPENPSHAAEMLRSLSGRTHTVCTAVTVAIPEKNEITLLSTHSETAVHMNSLSEPLIQAYVASGDPLGEAGAYAIQNQEFPLVGSIQGCYANVVGLPLCHCGELLRRAGVILPVHSSIGCRAHIRYNCEIDTKLLIQTAAFNKAGFKRNRSI